MRRILTLLLLFSIGTVLAVPGEETPPAEPAGIREVRKSPEKENREEESDLDRILSGEERIPIVSETELARTLGEKVDAVTEWFGRERHALLVLLIGTVLTLGIGFGVGIAMRRLIRARRTAKADSLRWQLTWALSDPLLLLAILVTLFALMLRSPLLGAASFIAGLICLAIAALITRQRTLPLIPFIAPAYLVMLMA